MNRNCASVAGCGDRGTITLLTKYTSNTPHLSWWQGRRDTTFTLTQYMYYVLTNCTRTAGPHTEAVINHSPNRLFPPWSKRVRHCAVSITFFYAAISITVSQLEECGGEQTPWHLTCSFWIHQLSCSFHLQYFWGCNMVLTQPWLEVQFPVSRVTPPCEYAVNICCKNGIKFVFNLVRALHKVPVHLTSCCVFCCFIFASIQQFVCLLLPTGHTIYIHIQSVTTQWVD